MSNGWALDEASTGDTNSRFGCTSSMEIYLWSKTYMFLSLIAVGSSNHLIFLPMRNCQSSWFSSRVASIFPICSPYQTTMRNLIRDGKILARIRMSRGCRKVSGGIQHNGCSIISARAKQQWGNGGHRSHRVFTLPRLDRHRGLHRQKSTILGSFFSWLAPTKVSQRRVLSFRPQSCHPFSERRSDLIDTPGGQGLVGSLTTVAYACNL